MSRKAPKLREGGTSLGWYDLPIVGERRRRQRRIHPYALAAIALAALIAWIVI